MAAPRPLSIVAAVLLVVALAAPASATFDILSQCSCASPNCSPGFTCKTVVIKNFFPFPDFSGGLCVPNSNQVSYGGSNYNLGSLGNSFKISSCGGTNGDPILGGFSGEQFEFAGKPGNMYSFISAPNHMVNVEMVGANLTGKANGGTFLGSVAVVYMKHTIVTAVDEAGKLTVTIDGTPYTKANLEMASNNAVEVALDGEGSMALIQLYREEYGHSVQIETAMLSITVFATLPAFDEYYQEYTRAYLNMVLGLKETTVSQIHGVLGQTAPLSVAAKPLQASAAGTIAPFAGEGEEADYEIPSLLSSDFKFSQFGKAPTKATEVARRHLIERSSAIKVFTARVGHRRA